MKTVLKISGALLLLAGFVAFIAVATGTLDTWLADHWTCASNHVRRECGWFEAKGSALELSGGAMLLGLVAYLLGGMSNERRPDGEIQAAYTVDLTRWTRR